MRCSSREIVERLRAAHESTRSSLQLRSLSFHRTSLRGSVGTTHSTGYSVGTNDRFLPVKS
jgi:hypothetical protein